MIVHVTDREGTTHSLETSTNTTLMELLRDASLGIEAVCGGNCLCATCHAYVNASVGKRGDVEAELLSFSSHFDERRSRLSCQIMLTEALDGVSVEVAPEE